MDRVQNDDSLIPPDGQPPNFIERPIIIVHNIGGGRQGYILNLTELDPALNEPGAYGIVLSDLLDHIAAAYYRTTGRDERDIRAQIAKVMKDEDCFKEKDPSRGRMKGATIMPPKN